MKKTKARVLVALVHEGVHYQVNDLIELEKDALEELTYRRLIDSAGEAVAYVERQRDRANALRRLQDDLID